MTKRLLVICPHQVGVVPGQRLKYEQYFHHIKEAGFELTVTPFNSPRLQKILYSKGHVPEKIALTLWAYLERSLLLFRLRSFDVVYVFLWVTPLGPPLFERLVRLLARKMVFDIDDLIYLREGTSHQNRFIQIFKGRRKPIYLMRVADHVITCTPYLDAFVRKFTARTTDISSTINTKTYQPVNPYANTNRLVIGWSGSHSTIKYLYLLENVFRRLRQQVDFKLLVMGTDNFSLPGIDAEVVPWSEAIEIPTLQRMDIGVYPLPNEEWVLGKSGLKALQYMALGIPTVATAIGANFRVIEDGVSGYLVDTEDAWVERITELAQNPSLRRSIGTSARKRVEELYSVEANAPIYIRILQSLVANGPTQSVQ